MPLRPRATVLALPKPPSTDDATASRLVKLNALESPLPPSPTVMAALRALEPELLRTAADAAPGPFHEAVAKHHDLDLTHVLPGEPVQLLAGAMGAYLEPGSAIATPWPADNLLPALCAVHGHRLLKADWLEDFALPTKKLLSLKADMILLANPNAPTGTAVAPEEVSELASGFAGLLVIDESWAAFAEEDCLSLLALHRNVLILRSLAGSHALAGLGLGYLLGDAQAIEAITRLGTAGPPDAVAQVAGAAALVDQDHADRIRQHIREERGRLILELQLMGFVVPPSQANFVLARHPQCPDAGSLHDGLLRLGILVHHWREPELEDAIRITVGTSQQNNALLAALAKLIESDSQPPRG